ncbi:MAG TPA: hypothetical protein VGC67_02675 [Cellulomonas sp.]
MLQRYIAALIGVLGLAAAALGIASATAWRADDPLVATVTAADGTPTLVTDPGVLELAGSPVTITVTAGSDPVVLAIGRDTDVDAWIGADAYDRVTGLSDWHTLATVEGEDAAGSEPSTTADATATAAATEAAATAAASPEPSASGTATADPDAVTAADPTGSDLWVYETSGDGSATLEWTGESGRWSLIAVSLGDTVPTLSLSWPQTVTTPWLWPGVAVGVLLVAVSLVLGIRLWRRARLGPDADWHDVSTGMIAAVARPDVLPAGTVLPGTAPVHVVDDSPGPAQPLTRRQIREAEAAGAAGRRRGRRPATGTIPVVDPQTGTIPVVGEQTGAVPVVEPPQASAAPGSVPSDPVPSGDPASRPSRFGRRASGRSTPEQPTPERSGDAPPSAAGPQLSEADAARTGAAPADGAQLSGAESGALTRDAASTASAAAPELPTAESGEEPSTRRRGLTGLLGRRGRTRGADGPATEPSVPEPSIEPSASAGSSQAATSWTPVPGAASRPTPAAGTTGTTASGSSSAPVVAPSAAGSSASATSPVLDPEDESLSQTQRADAWRRMWGFTPSGDQSDQPDPESPSGTGPTPSAGSSRPTEEDR